MVDRLKGKVAIVAGAGSVGPGWGNGKATSVLFAREGAKVFAVDVNSTAAEETKGIIESEGGDCTVHKTDVSKASDVMAMVESCVEAYGRIDILHNNVGIIEVGGPVETAEESWNRVMDVNIKSVFLTCKYVIPHMERQGGGAIVNLSSIGANRYYGVPYVSYTASKAGVKEITKTIAVQYASKKIRCNVILPGLMNTPMIVEPLKEAYAGGDIEEMLRIRDAQCPLGHMGDAWDVAYAALFLASDEAKYITGAELVVDGGITCKCA